MYIIIIVLIPRSSLTNTPEGKAPAVIVNDTGQSFIQGVWRFINSNGNSIENRITTL